MGVSSQLPLTNLDNPPSLGSITLPWLVLNVDLDQLKKYLNVLIRGFLFPISGLLSQVKKEIAS